MDNRTRVALGQSIKHWEENLAEENPRRIKVYSTACPLCDLFNQEDNDCEGCPVMEKTGLENCEGSPWIEAARAFEAWKQVPGNENEKERWKIAAKAELDFLRKLDQSVASEPPDGL